MSNSTMAYIALLKCEAKNAESRAKRLRETAAAIIANAEGKLKVLRLRAYI